MINHAAALTSEINQISKEYKTTPPTLIIVSKNQPIQSIQILYNEGYRHFGENRIEELLDKASQLPSDIIWHFMGHIQSKKLNKILSVPTWIHSVHSIGLLEQIDKKCHRLEKVQQVLLQVNISQEEEKQGLHFSEVEEAINFSKNLKNIQVMGLMGMGPRPDSDNYTTILDESFEKLSKLYFKIKDTYKLTVLSIGMSSDYPAAIKHQATHLRIGSAIFS